MKVWDSVKRLFLPSMASSYFRPNVTLHEWWLTSIKTYDGRDAIGVEGITAAIYQNQAEQCFTSAPILKAFDYHGLETVDGIHIILDGNIDKDRTLKNGFPPEVFDHFKIGFPENWEEFSVDTGVQDVTLPLQDCDIFSVDIGVQEHDHTVFSNETITVPDASSLKVPHEDTIEAEQSPLTSDIEDDPSVKMSPLNNHAYSIKHNVSRNDLATISKCSGVSGSKSRSLLLQNVANLDKVTPIDPQKLEDTDIFRKVTNDVISNTKAGNRDEQNLENISLNLSVACEQDSNEAASFSQDMDNMFTIKGKQNDKDRVVRRKKINLEVGISNQEKNEDADVQGESQVTTRKGYREAKFTKAKFSDPSSSGSVGDEFLVKASSDTAARRRVDCQETIMTRTKSKRNLTSGSSARRQLIAISPKSARTISKAEKKKNRKGRSSSPHREDTCNAAAAAVRHRMDFQEAILTPSKSERKLSSESLAERQLIAISHESAKTIMTRTKSKRNLTSGSSARRQLIAVSPKSARTISKAEKKKNRKGRTSSPYREGTCNAAAAAAAVRHRMDSQEAIVTPSKSKRKSTSESLAERQLIEISHESAITISKAKKGSKVIMLSPESFGGKKSRSGRVLLPPLEYWRNQIVLYDKDRNICGIEERCDTII